jgi:hypothetical protein
MQVGACLRFLSLVEFFGIEGSVASLELLQDRGPAGAEGGVWTMAVFLMHLLLVFLEACRGRAPRIQRLIPSSTLAINAGRFGVVAGGLDERSHAFCHCRGEPCGGDFLSGPFGATGLVVVAGDIADRIMKPIIEMVTDFFLKPTGCAKGLSNTETGGTGNDTYLFGRSGAAFHDLARNGLLIGMPAFLLDKSSLVLMVRGVEVICCGGIH